MPITRAKPINQHRGPNFIDYGDFYLIRCFQCNPLKGKMNKKQYIQRGVCAWCGWSAEKDDTYAWRKAKSQCPMCTGTGTIHQNCILR